MTKASQQRFRPNSVLYVICILKKEITPYLTKVYAGTPLEIEELCNGSVSIFLKGTDNVEQGCADNESLPWPSQELYSLTPYRPLMRLLQPNYQPAVYSRTHRICWHCPELRRRHRDAKFWKVHWEESRNWIPDKSGLVFPSWPRPWAHSLSGETCSIPRHPSSPCTRKSDSLQFLT